MIHKKKKKMPIQILIFLCANKELVIDFMTYSSV